MKEKRSKLIFTGDLLPADRQNTLGIGIGTKIENKGLLWSEEIKAILFQSDFSIINLEGPIIKDQTKLDKKSFAGNSDLLHYLTGSGVTHAHIANNHILEHEQSAFKETISLLADSSIQPIGVSNNEHPEIVAFRHNEIKIAIAGYNSVHDIPNPDCYAELNKLNIINTLSQQDMIDADIRVLVFHWGNEYIHIPSWEQMELGKMAIDHGAHLVVGHHPHVIQPIEEYKNGLICYSLGNFLFDMLWNKSVRTGAILEIDVSNSGIKNWKIHGCQYDHSYYIKLLHQEQISKKMRKWESKMVKMSAKGENYYIKKYRRMLKTNRFFARLQMKKQLILQLPSISRDNRMQILWSILHKISRQIKGLKV